MRSSSVGRRSSMNPVRVSTFDREDRNLPRTDTKRSQSVIKTKPSTSMEGSQLPRPRIRVSSSDRASLRKSNMISIGKTPLRQQLGTTPNKHTPGSNPVRLLGLREGARSPSAERASNIGSKTRKDTRPLMDKTYQNEMLNKVDDFFRMSEQSTMLNSNGSIKPITLKMFVDVTAFLIKYLDIKQMLTLNNYVEEMPKIAKRLLYPGVVSKSWLKTANAMHSWPNVLGWLSWLVQICEIKHIAMRFYKLENLPCMGLDEQAEISRNIFLLTIKMYRAWNDERHQEEAALVNEYLHLKEMQEGVIEDDVVKVELALERDMANLKATEKKSNEIRADVANLKDTLESLKADEFKQSGDLEAQEDYIKGLNIEIQHITAECDALHEQKELEMKEEEELAIVIKSQPMSKSERDKILIECSTIQNYIQPLKEYLDQIEKEIYTQDLKLSSLNNNINKTALSYNKEIFMHLSGDIGVDLEQLRMPEGGVVSSEIQEIFYAKGNLMNEVKEFLRKRLVEVEDSIESRTIELKALQEKHETLEKDNEILAEKLKQRKAYIHDMKSEEAKLQKEIQSLQAEIEQIQRDVPNCRESLKVVEQLKETYKEHVKKNELLESSALRFFNEFYEILGEHRNEMYKLLENIQTHIHVSDD